jgi:hypothetical protein
MTTALYEIDTSEADDGTTVPVMSAETVSLYEALRKIRCTVPALGLSSSRHGTQLRL